MEWNPSTDHIVPSLVNLCCSYILGYFVQFPCHRIWFDLIWFIGFAERPEPYTKLYRIVCFTWDDKRLHRCEGVHWAGARWWEIKYCCAFFLNSDNRVDDWMCFGRVLKMCDAKYNGEDWKRVELALGSGKKLWWRREWSALARG